MRTETSETADETQIPWPEDIPMVPLWPTAARPFNLGRTIAFRLARRGEFPVEVLKVGGRYQVRTADLRRQLGLQVYKRAS